MANTLAPFGFAQVGTASNMPNYARAGSASPYRIKAGFVTSVYFGDAVRMWVAGDDSSSAAGYITPWVAGDGDVSTPTKILVGIFVGCQYYSLSQHKTVYSKFYPGADAAADVDAYVVDDPESQWMVQAGVVATPFTQVYVGSTADVVVTPVGNTTTGISGMSLDTPQTSVYFPFKLVNIINTPPTANGRDITTAYNYVTVAFNNQQYKARLGV